MAMNEYYVALVGLAGVLIGALIVVGKDIYFERRSRWKSQQYLAIRVVTKLDDFVEGCVEVSIDTGQPDKDGYHHANSDAPVFDIDSLAVDWKSIPSELMYKILSFPTLVDSANNNIHAVAEYQASPPDYSEFFEERRFQYSKLGLTAYELAEKLRVSYKIRPRAYENWDPIKSLQDRLNEIEYRREQFYEQQKSMFEEMEKARLGEE